MSYGRKKGEGITTRQATLEVRKILQEKGIDPISYLADHLIETATPNPNINDKDRIKIAMELAKYYAPQLKSVDVGNSDEEGFIVKVRKFSDKADSKLKDMMTEEGKAQRPDGE
jgi:hypothetical protein